MSLRSHAKNKTRSVAEHVHSQAYAYPLSSCVDVFKFDFSLRENKHESSCRLTRSLASVPLPSSLQTLTFNLHFNDFGRGHAASSLQSFTCECSFNQSLAGVDGRQVIKGKGKQKGKKGKSKGKGFGKKGKMNEVGYENDYDGTDMWWQDDGSWWEDQSWMETSQVWNGEWDESWDTAWCGEGETWDESWSWPAIEDGTVHGSAGGTAQGVQSLVLSPLISDVFADVFTGLVFQLAVQVNVAVNAVIFQLMKLFAMFPFLVCNVLKRTDHLVHVGTACSSVKNLVRIWDSVSCDSLG